MTQVEAVEVGTGRGAAIADVLAWLRRQTAQVLCYHSISRSPGDPFAVTPERFEEQMAWLQASARPVLPGSALLRELAQGRPAAGAVVLTFDDALQDFYDTAAPILERYGLPATVFVPTARVSGCTEWDHLFPKRAVMPRSALQDLHAAGVELGSHTATHPNLTALDSRALDYELCASFDSVASISNRPPTIAYPFGLSSPQVRERARAAGYPAAFSTGFRVVGNGPRTDGFVLRRELIDARTDLARFRRIVAGIPDPGRLADAVRMRAGSPA